MMPPEITADQREEIQLAALSIADKAMRLAAFPTFINGPWPIDQLKAEMQRIEAVAYEIDQVNSHDDCTAVSDISDRRAA